MSNLQIQDLTILLVEPSVTQQKIILQNLAAAGIDKVDCVGSGKEAIEQLSKLPPDLVISSMYFEDMTALELISHIREHSEQTNIPFMLISSEVRFGRIDPIKQAGVVAILPKPFDSAALNTALRNTLHFLEPDELELANYDPTRLRVLVVDDSALARKFIIKTLNGLGIEQITEAADGKAAMNLLQDNADFDLIVSDYNMPEMDGKALVEYVRSDNKVAHIPVLMVTSEQNRAVLNNIEQVGVSAICDKPFEPDHVKQLLANILA
ncbi:response regulator [Pleionea litopenaei]|uniref:Response regulator n=1 Tax=Pleionea litopenaei TaxID=3070815 RepID=A0AA51RUJ1_9GAMM|nr:response regulator [Pleionea sp. HL-JVS1]WMS87770.1 response regulator [Pleionea sp. HL-JVS1]